MKHMLIASNTLPKTASVVLHKCVNYLAGINSLHLQESGYNHATSLLVRTQQGQMLERVLLEGLEALHHHAPISKRQLNMFTRNVQVRFLSTNTRMHDGCRARTKLFKQNFFQYGV